LEDRLSDLEITKETKTKLKINFTVILTVIVTRLVKHDKGQMKPRNDILISSDSTCLQIIQSSHESFPVTTFIGVLSVNKYLIHLSDLKLLLHTTQAKGDSFILFYLGTEWCLPRLNMLFWLIAHTYY